MRIGLYFGWRNPASAQEARRLKNPRAFTPGSVNGALRKGRIEYTKARAIARVKDSSKRSQLLEEAIALDVSLTQIKQRIADLKAKSTGEATAPNHSIKRDLLSLWCKINQPIQLE